eukprot:TRINITY_DN13567_c0_g1_i1.p1 TRINITY_DN13567_c0_g1~~TRINITY_DN13567_c0_g1_i1.p1  ORF type:complete len:629 (+),score=113.87 TRINITY_DN13567_c0_g1_i1:86-1972(+)
MRRRLQAQLRPLDASACAVATEQSFDLSRSGAHLSLQGLFKLSASGCTRLAAAPPGGSPPPSGAQQAFPSPVSAELSLSPSPPRGRVRGSPMHSPPAAASAPWQRRGLPAPEPSGSPSLSPRRCSPPLRALHADRGAARTRDDCGFGEWALSDVDVGDAVLGRGSSGRVRRGVHRPTGVPAAVKEVRIADRSNRDGLRRELRALLALRGASPFVITLYGAFFRDGAVLLALELMGGSLADAAPLPVPETAVRGAAVQALQGLDFLHRERRQMHRDVKPANLLYSAQGHVKISDFGSSGELLQQQHTRESFVGTLYYMAPERIEAGSYGCNSDCWALGLALLDCLVGGNPLRLGSGDTVASVLERAKAQRELLTRAAEHQATPPFLVFLSQCLAPEPARRPSAAQLLRCSWVLGTARSLPEATEAGRQAVAQWAASRRAPRGCCPAAEWAGNSLPSSFGSPRASPPAEEFATPARHFDCSPQACSNAAAAVEGLPDLATPSAPVKSRRRVLLKAARHRRAQRGERRAARDAPPRGPPGLSTPSRPSAAGDVVSAAGDVPAGGRPRRGAAALQRKGIAFGTPRRELRRRGRRLVYSGGPSGGAAPRAASSSPLDAAPAAVPPPQLCDDVR